MRIKVEDDILDSYRNEIIAQNYEVNEIGDIATRQGGFSNEFTIPLTSKNRDILGIPDDINSISTKPYEKVDATLIDQGTPVATGYLRYQVVGDNEIKVSFFSDNVEWFSLLKDKSLRDLDLSEFDHDWTTANIVTAIDADKSSGYTYPLIDYGEFGELTSLVVESGQMFPAMFVNTLVNRIFFEIGWKEEGEMIDHPLYKRMIVPFSAKSFVHTQQYLEDNSFSEVLPATQSGTPASSIDVPLIWTLPATSLLTIGAPGNYNIRFVADVDFNFTGSVATGTFVIQNNGVEVIRGAVNSIFVGQIVIDTDIFLEDGDIEVILSIIIVPVSTFIFSVFLTTTTIDVSLKEEIFPGSEIQIQTSLPDIKQSDFLKYLAFVFGGVPQANNLSKTINFGLFRSIKDNIPNAIDWSSKIDMSKSRSIDFTELLTKYKSISTLKYADDDNDAELTAYEAETDRTFGDGQFDIDNEHIAGVEVLYEAPFSPMININSFDNTMYIPQIRFKVEGGSDLKPEPKIAILSKNFTVDTLSLGLYEDMIIVSSEDQYSTDTVSSIPFCWFTKTSYISVIDALLDSLSFDQITFPNAIGDPLKDRFLKDYEEILNSVKYTKAFFHLTETDINELDFLIPIFIDHYKAYFYISKINNYKGSAETTEAELVKIADG